MNLTRLNILVFCYHQPPGQFVVIAINFWIFLHQHSNSPCPSTTWQNVSRKGQKQTRTKPCSHWLLDMSQSPHLMKLTPPPTKSSWSPDLSLGNVASGPVVISDRDSVELGNRGGGTRERMGVGVQVQIGDAIGGKKRGYFRQEGSEYKAYKRRAFFPQDSPYGHQWRENREMRPGHGMAQIEGWKMGNIMIRPAFKT